MARILDLYFSQWTMSKHGKMKLHLFRKSETIGIIWFYRWIILEMRLFQHIPHTSTCIILTKKNLAYIMLAVLRKSWKKIISYDTNKHKSKAFFCFITFGSPQAVKYHLQWNLVRNYECYCSPHQNYIEIYTITRKK